MALWDDFEKDKYLYHYTTRQAALGAILAKSELRFGLFRYMNDPRESKTWSFTREEAREDGSSELVRDSDNVMREVQESAKVLAMTRDAPAASETKFGQFGRGYAHSGLWTHYAGGHSGVCLVFDRQALHRTIVRTLRSKGGLYSGCVTYGDAESDEIEAFMLSGAEIRRLGLERAVDEHVRNWHPILFFRKSREWENEREYRWLLRSPEPAPEFVPIADSLRGVVVGQDFPPSDYDAVEFLAEKFANLSIATCSWENGTPQIFEGLTPLQSKPPSFRYAPRAQRVQPLSLEVRSSVSPESDDTE